MGDWVDVGRVVKLQVQRDLLRRGPVYGTGNLAEVSVLRLTPDGPIGFDGSSWIVDRHHRAHPASARYDPARALSIGFTSHYEYIWGRFDPIPLGSAGENLIVETLRSPSGPRPSPNPACRSPVSLPDITTPGPTRSSRSGTNCGGVSGAS